MQAPLSAMLLCVHARAFMKLQGRSIKTLRFHARETCFPNITRYEATLRQIYTSYKWAPRQKIPHSIPLVNEVSTLSSHASLVWRKSLAQLLFFRSSRAVPLVIYSFRSGIDLVVVCLNKDRSLMTHQLMRTQSDDSRARKQRVNIVVVLYISDDFFQRWSTARLLLFRVWKSLVARRQIFLNHHLSLMIHSPTSNR